MRTFVIRHGRSRPRLAGSGRRWRWRRSIYFLAGYHKLRRSGIDWAIGDNFRYIMLWGPTYGRARWESLARWIGEHLWAAKPQQRLAARLRAQLPGRRCSSAGCGPSTPPERSSCTSLTWFLLGLDYWAWAATVLVIFVDWPAVFDRLAAVARRHRRRRDSLPTAA